MVGCLAKDFKNYWRDKRVLVEGLDTELLVAHFDGEKENSGFHYVVDVTKMGHLKSVFWCDTISWRSYAFFGDVVVLDATYKMNKYEVKFVPFVGVNHHNQNIIFGCGLIGQEHIEDYMWLLLEWIKAMSRME